MSVTLPPGFLDLANIGFPPDANASLDQIVSRISRGKYVLVIGNEMILNPDTGNSDSMKFFVEHTCNTLTALLRQKVDYHRYVTFNMLDQYFKQTRSAYLDVSNRFASSIQEEISAYHSDEDKFKILKKYCNPSLIDLIREKWFRVVLTTTTDPLLETIMRIVWGDDLQIKNIFGETVEERDFTYDDIDGSEYYPYPPTLYYVFGKADITKDKDKNQFVLTDNDVIECIARWLGELQPKNFFDFISTKRLLSIGCRLDDWCFRFFWHALRNSNKSNGDIVLSLNENHESDIQLRNYIKAQEIHLEENAEMFVKQLVDSLSKEEMKKTFIQNNKYGGIFISYASEDRAIALSIYRHLVDAGFNVWMDIRLNGGAEYEKRIADAIKQCKIFLPILSDQIKRDLENDKSDRWYQKEWCMADGENVGWTTVPVIALGYNCRAEYHQKTTKRILQSTGYDLQTKSFVMDGTKFDWKNRPMSELIETIKNIMRNAK